LHNALQFAIAASAALVRRPAILSRLLRAVFYPSLTPSGEAVAYLMSLGVSPRRQGRGIGKQMVHAFLAAACERGVKTVYLSTDRDNNVSVNHFYRNQGFVLARAFQTPERRAINEYRYDLSHWQPRTTG
jgi:ribosomal protein S18 acetylase RimI-like enzyme